MTYARKVSIKKLNLKTYSDFFISLWSRNNHLRFWSTFTRGNRLASRIRQHYNIFSQRGYSTRIKVSNFDKLLFLGGSFKENDAIWVSFVNGLVSAERLLERTQEEPDDQFFFFMQTTQQKSEIIEVLLLHLLTDIFLSTLHHFCKLKYFDLEELWFQVEKIPSLSSPFMILPMI